MAVIHEWVGRKPLLLRKAHRACGHVVTLDERRSWKHLADWCDDCRSRCLRCDGYVPLDDSPSGRHRRNCDECARVVKRDQGRDRRERLRSDPERFAVERERQRIKNTLRYRALTRVTDLTPAEVLAMKRAASVCAMCGDVLPDDLGARHLEHIWPLNAGGTHTRDNVRIACEACNLARPKDGSDAVGHQLNIWTATDEAARLRPEVSKRCRHCGSGDVPAARLRRSRYECLGCVPHKPRGGCRGPRPDLWKSEYVGTYDIAAVERLMDAGKGYKAIASELGIGVYTSRALVRRVKELRSRLADA